jgi:hypothetical protein
LSMRSVNAFFRSSSRPWDSNAVFGSRPAGNSSTILFLMLLLVAYVSPFKRSMQLTNTKILTPSLPVRDR